METAARYVDPILVSLVVILTIGVPLRMTWRGMLALLKRAPDREVVSGIEHVVRQALGDLPVEGLFIRVVQPGRTTYALVHVLLGEDGLQMDIRRADQLRRSIAEAIVAARGTSIIDVVFTGIRGFAAPTAGFGPDQLLAPSVTSAA
jgi:predicted Co/Zn/Cd cation transporter (cation efflux family)